MSLIGRFEHLPKRPKSDEALPLLEKIASQVKPIMAKRGWKVGILAEFLPSNPALLGNNMNAGQRINLRLRPPGGEASFYEYEQLVLVMLHELTHIEHGPHDASFYKLLAELEEEFYELKRKGYSGEGFHGSGNHLSGFKVPEYVGKEKGMLAAQKRLDVQKKIGKGGVLGGSGTDYRNRSMKEVLAEAAERRMRDDKSCQTSHAGHAKEVEDEVRKAMEESEGVDAADLPTVGAENNERGSSPEIEILEGPPAASPSMPVHPASIATKRKPLAVAKPSLSRPKQPLPPPPPVSAPSRPDPFTPSLPPGQWSCEACTLINDASAKACEACSTARPGPIATIGRMGPEGWYCDFCGAGPRDMAFWSCTECGWVRKWG